MRRAQSPPGFDAKAPDWAHDYANAVEQFDNQRLSQPTRHPGFYIAKLPPAGACGGSTLFVLDTLRMAYSDGAVWRYCSDETAV